jgi:integrase/recombinase XerD
MSSFASPFAPQLERLLAYKRALGFGYLREEAYLREFDSFASSWSEAVLSEALVRHYLAASEGSRPQRLTVLRALGRFCILGEPRTFVAPRRFLGIRRRRPVLRIFSRAEASRFLEACDALPDTPAYPCGLIHGTALRTLLLTGLRRGELQALRGEDVDLDEEIITVRCGKFGKARFVPLAADLAHRLRLYRQAISRRFGHRRPEDAFFPRADGRLPVARTSLYKSFRRVLKLAGIEHLGRGRGPRLHDLRHAFAVLRLLTWYEARADLRAKLPLLATYLGHVGLATSQIYLHMTEDLVGEVNQRLLDHFGDLIVEVQP